MSITSPAHRQNLEYLHTGLNGAGYSVSLVPGGTQAPYDALLALVEDTADPDRRWQVEISFMPQLEEQLEDVSILQCFAPISIGTAEGEQVIPQLLWTINRINTKLPLTGFGYLESENTLYFKHNAMLHNQAAGRNEEVVGEILDMITFQLNNFGYILYEVANGLKSGREALQASPFSQLYL